MSSRAVAVVTIVLATSNGSHRIHCNTVGVDMKGRHSRGFITAGWALFR